MHPIVTAVHLLFFLDSACQTLLPVGQSQDRVWGHNGFPDFPYTSLQTQKPSGEHQNHAKERPGAI